MLQNRKEKPMLPKDMFSHWEGVRRDLVSTIEAFDESELEYVPFEGSRKIGDIMLHIADAEDGWLRFCVTKELDAWPDFYNLTNYPDNQSIIHVLAEVHSRTYEHLSNLGESGFEASITDPWGDDFALLWIFWHIIEHEIHHRGELSLILGLLGREGIIT
jgi:uncharacterized damage-inducible protein DinB